MQLELTYQVPWGRLAKLSRSAGRKAFQTVWLLFWLLVVGMAALIVGLNFYGDTLDLWMQSAGMPLAARIAVNWVPFVGMVAGWILLYRWNVNQARNRLDFDLTTRLTMDDGGLRIATEGIEYYLKWRGITQMLMERDGVVVSCGNLFFLVPDAAFSDACTRLAFIRDVYGHLTAKARSLSEKYIRPVLGQDS
jgi:hypothetical protein